jgi:hypothetical protein
MRRKGGFRGDIWHTRAQGVYNFIKEGRSSVTVLPFTCFTVLQAHWTEPNLSGLNLSPLRHFLPI